MHPGGLAPRIENFAQWRAHLCVRLRGQVHATGDEKLLDLLREVESYPAPAGASKDIVGYDSSVLAVPLRLRVAGNTLDFISTTTIFGTPLDITLAELAIETLLPANAATAATAETLRALVASNLRVAAL